MISANVSLGDEESEDREEGWKAGPIELVRVAATVPSREATKVIVHSPAEVPQRSDIRSAFSSRGRAAIGASAGQTNS
jgi:hypothetical protein